MEALSYYTLRASPIVSVNTAVHKQLNPLFECVHVQVNGGSAFMTFLQSKYQPFCFTVCGRLGKRISQTATHSQNFPTTFNPVSGEQYKILLPVPAFSGELETHIANFFDTCSKNFRIVCEL